MQNDLRASADPEGSRLGVGIFFSQRTSALDHAAIKTLPVGAPAFDRADWLKGLVRVVSGVP